MKYLSFNTRRTITGLIGCVAVMITLNDLAGLGVFGDHARRVTAGAFLILALTLRFVGPSIEEIEKYRSTRDVGK